MRHSPEYAPSVAYYLFNVVPDAVSGPALRDEATRCLRIGMWGIDDDEPHRDALAAGDLALVYVGAPERTFLGRVEVASAAHRWTPLEAQQYPGGASGGVLLSRLLEWDPPVPMSAVLPRIGSEKARADFDKAVVRITRDEYETALAVAAERRDNRSVDPAG